MIAFKKKITLENAATIAHTAMIVARVPRGRFEGKQRMFSEKVRLDLKEEKYLEMQLGW